MPYDELAVSISGFAFLSEKPPDGISCQTLMAGNNPEDDVQCPDTAVHMVAAISQEAGTAQVMAMCASCWTVISESGLVADAELVSQDPGTLPS